MYIWDVVFLFMLKRMENIDISSDKKLFPTWVDIASIIGIYLVANVLTVLAMPLFFKEDNALRLFVTYVLTFGITLLYAYTYRKIRMKDQEQPSRVLNFKKSSPILILWGIILIIASGVVIEPLLELFPEQWFTMLNRYMGSGIWAIVTAVVAAPILEELLFRGVIQRSISLKYGGLVGVVVAAAIFGIIHFNPVQVVNAFVVGLILGFIYYKTNSLISVMIIHAVNNAMAYLLWTISADKSQLNMIRDSISSDMLYYIIYGVALAVTVVSFVKMFSLMSKKADEERTNKKQEQITEKEPEPITEKEIVADEK